jgi:hypothetical protein
VAALVAATSAVDASGADRAPGQHPATTTLAPPVGVPATTQSNISPYPVLERLGRWNGAAFVPVAAGSIAPGHAIFMSHGWSPGYRTAYEQLQASTDHLVTAWDPQLVDGAGLSMMTRFEQLATALQQADPTAAVVMFSWVDQSSTGTSVFDASGPELATEVNGHRFATAIDEALAPDFVSDGGQVHLIGHSFGANVATTAALALTTPPRQLTLLDSPEIELTRVGGAKNDLRYKLPRLDLGRGPGQVFVDNYISALGERYSTYPGLESVVDVQTRPPDEDLAEEHSFAINWYADSAAATDPQVGYGWSPLAGAEVTDVAAFSEQQSVDAPLELTAVEGAPDPAVVARFSTTVDPLVLAGPSAGVLEVTGDPAGPTAANLTFGTTDDSLWLTFEKTLVGRPGDLATVWIDGRQRAQMAIPDDGAGPPGSFVILYDEAPGTHVLSLTISGPTPADLADPASRASLRGLAIAGTPGITRNLTATETYRLAAAVIASGIAGVLALIGLIALVVVLVLRHRRRRRTEASPPT